MQALYPWPDQPGLSLLLLYVLSALFLWAAREPMLRLLRSFGELVGDGLAGLADTCRQAATAMRERGRAELLAAGTLDAQGRLERELARIDGAFSEKLGDYAKVHRRLDDLLVQLESDYRQCGDTPPEVPGWSSAVEAISAIPATGDPNVQKVLETIRKSSQESEKKALAAYRDDTARRHKLLGAMAGRWKEVRALMARMQDSATRALESTQRIQGYVETYEKTRTDTEAAARALSFSATKLFLVSLLVLGVALGGAFINFQLIALPMSELVPAGARVGGVPVATVSALVIVLMETALGIFVMDMLGFTDLFPKLQGVPLAKRRLVLGLALGGLFFLASVESSLAVLREQIVEANAALQRSLAGEADGAVAVASTSMIPVVGQAVLGFVLPWVLALVAIPLEMLLDSGRYVMTALTSHVLAACGQVARLLGHLARALTTMVGHVYDVYIGIPLRIERAVRGAGDDGRPDPPRRSRRGVAGEGTPSGAGAR